MSGQQPTDVELRILRILWARRSATAREVHNCLNATHGKNYSTTVKMLSVMLEKGLVKRDDRVRPQTFTAAVTQQATQKRFLTNLLQKVYGGSAGSLVLHALTAGNASKTDLKEIRRLIDELERDSNEAPDSTV